MHDAILSSRRHGLQVMHACGRLSTYYAAAVHLLVNLSFLLLLVFDRFASTLLRLISVGEV